MCVCYNLTSLLNGINSSRKCINESSMFVCSSSSSSSATAAAVVCCCPPICWLSSSCMFLLHFTCIRSCTPAFYQHLCTAHPCQRLLLAPLMGTWQSTATFKGCRRWLNYADLMSSSIHVVRVLWHDPSDLFKIRPCLWTFSGYIHCVLVIVALNSLG